MRKKILILLSLILPAFVYADSCTINNDTQTTQDRTLSCDTNFKKTTTFKTESEEKILENEVCTIKCTESIIFSIDPVKKVLAGTSFRYPLYYSGERKCTSTYKYQEYETKIKKLVGEYEKLTGTDKDTKANEIVNYYTLKKQCDEFTKQDSDYKNEYKLNANVELKVDTSTGSKTIKYVSLKINDYESNVNVDEVNYASCGYDESLKKCAGSTKTISNWTETARIYGKYTMPNTYVERYTGEIKNVPSTKTCNAGDRYFVDFKELTNPQTGATDETGYSLTLTADEIGNNIDKSKDKWKLSVNCSYKVKNLIFPQGSSTTTVDENYKKYGSSTFIYRQIDIDDPFPNREPAANWQGKENIIISKPYETLLTLQKFEISLDRGSIKRVRDYNSNYPYDTFNLSEMEKSLFIINNPTIVKRK